MFLAEELCDNWRYDVTLKKTTDRKLVFFPNAPANTMDIAGIRAKC